MFRLEFDHVFGEASSCELQFDLESLYALVFRKMIPPSQLLLDLLVAFHLLGTYFKDIKCRHFNIWGGIDISMRKEFNQLWGNKFQVFFLTIRVISCQHFFLGLDEIKHEPFQWFVKYFT